MGEKKLEEEKQRKILTAEKEKKDIDNQILQQPKETDDFQNKNISKDNTEMQNQLGTRANLSSQTNVASVNHTFQAYVPSFSPQQTFTVSQFPSQSVQINQFAVPPSNVNISLPQQHIMPPNSFATSPLPQQPLVHSHPIINHINPVIPLAGGSLQTPMNTMPMAGIVSASTTIPAPLHQSYVNSNQSDSLSCPQTFQNSKGNSPSNV